MDKCSELSAKGEFILTCIDKGEITPAEASNLMSVITSQARIIEIDELERRVTVLEQGHEHE